MADPDALTGDETILVAEDELTVRELICDVLRLHGYTVLEAQDGDEALRIAGGHAGPIHLLVVDVVMGGLPATGLVQRLSGDRPGLKAIYISGYTDDLVQQRGVIHTGQNFLQKPFALDTLTRMVRDVLDGR